MSFLQQVVQADAVVLPQWVAIIAMGALVGMLGWLLKLLFNLQTEQTILASAVGQLVKQLDEQGKQQHEDRRTLDRLSALSGHNPKEHT
jgi:hypothetical protein